MFPEWAPSNLVEHYINRFERSDFPQTQRFTTRRTILNRLITNPEMERVWKMLYQSRKPSQCDNHKHKSYGDGLMALHLWFNAERAYFQATGKITTRNEDVSKYQEIAKAAKSLAVKLSQSRLDESPLHWFPSAALNSIFESDIKPEKAKGCFCLVKDESEFHKKGGIYQEVKAKDLLGNEIIEYWRVAENSKDFFCHYVITPQYPSLSEILTALAYEAENETKYEATRDRIARGPSTSVKTVFIRSLLPFWLENLGTPHYRTFAALCRVVLYENSIDEDDVKDALKGYKIKT